MLSVEIWRGLKGNIRHVGVRGSVVSTNIPRVIVSSFVNLHIAL